MSVPGPLGDNPFEGLPFLGDLAGMLRRQGPVSWDAARQLAAYVATGGLPEANVEPTDRMKLEELGRVAELRVASATGLATSVTGRVVTVLPVTRGEWARRTLEGWRPVLERLAVTLSGAAEGATGDDADSDAEVGGDPAAQLMGGLMKMVGPMLLGMQSGSMVGHLARHALGQYELPVPRPPSDEVLVVPANMAEFGEEWSLPLDDLRLWVCLRELTHHAVLGVPHVRERLEGLLLEYVGGFRVDPGALEQRLGTLDPTDPSALQDALGDPTALLGAMQSQAQQALLPRLEALTAVIEGYVDHVMEAVGTGLISSYGMLTEALHRRRVEASPADRFVAHLLGLELGRAQYERGQRFVEGVVERAGADALEKLWRSPRELPTPNEIDAPGLWLARIELPDDAGDGDDGGPGDGDAG